MGNSISLELQQKNTQNIQQLQRLIMSRQMQQALHLLQMPIMEIAPVIEEEMTQNPVLEYTEDDDEESQDAAANENEEGEAQEDESSDAEAVDQPELSFEENNLEVLKQLDDDFYDYLTENSGFVARTTRDDEKLQSFLESSVRAEETLFEHLMEQAKQTFSSERDRSIAEEIVGNIDAYGFLKTSLDEIAATSDCTIEDIERILKEIQGFHPAGIGARSLRESLLIQLKFQRKENTLAYTLVDKHFDDLLHNRITIMTKKLHCTTEEIGKAIEETIAKLDIHPGTSFSHSPISYIVPDATIEEGEDNTLKVIVNQDAVPKIRLNRRYLKMLDDETISKETKDFIRQKITSAKWLVKNVLQRNSTLQNIAESLAELQKEFFLSPKGKLVPLTMSTIADKIGVHESTIARAVANKYIETPRGLFPLRFFFTNSLTTEAGEEISTSNVRNLIKDLITNENKKKPLSDQAISTLMKAKGVNCARRTVAKYRTLMNFGTTQQRKKF
jgi:RNA polymerase sigma-54 factor